MLTRRRCGEGGGVYASLEGGVEREEECMLTRRRCGGEEECMLTRRRCGGEEECMLTRRRCGEGGGVYAH